MPSAKRNRPKSNSTALPTTLMAGILHLLQRPSHFAQRAAFPYTSDSTSILTERDTGRFAFPEEHLLEVPALAAGAARAAPGLGGRAGHRDRGFPGPHHP